MAWTIIILVAWAASLLFVYKMGRLRGETDAMKDSTEFLRHHQLPQNPR